MNQQVRGLTKQEEDRCTDAWYIWQGAVNPKAICNAIIDACNAIPRKEWQKHPVFLLELEQLASLFGFTLTASLNDFYDASNLVEAVKQRRAQEVIS